MTRRKNLSRINMCALFYDYPALKKYLILKSRQIKEV
jgi:hypothetical protein